MMTWSAARGRISRRGVEERASVPNLSGPNVSLASTRNDSTAGRPRSDRALRLADRRRGDPRDDHVDPRHDDRQRRTATRSGGTCTARSRRSSGSITGYLLALAAVIPVTGWAARRFGAKRVYLVSLVLFTLGSTLCGAGDLEHLAGDLSRAAGSRRRDDHAGRPDDHGRGRRAQADGPGDGRGRRCRRCWRRSSARWSAA